MALPRGAFPLALAFGSLLSVSAWAAPAKGAAPGASPLWAAIDAATERCTAPITDIRHDLHLHPELSNREVRTAGKIADYLKGLGYEVKTGIAKTGVTALLKGGKPGPLIAVRADIDALPVTENTDLPFKSTQRTTFLGQEVGVAHACGHDIHTSVQLGVATVLKSIQKDIPGSILFLFQPAEEGAPPGEEGGADLMLKEGVFTPDKPVAVFGLHTTPTLEVGNVGYTPGPAFAAVDQFRAVIKGKQSHGAMPHLSVDPVVTAAQVILAFQTIRSRTLPPLEPSVITVGIVRGGERFNIIPGVALEGTVRTYSADARATVERRMREILAGITQAAGGTGELDYKKNAPATINDPALAEKVRPLLERTLGAEHVKVVDPTMGGEDFSYFANATPGFYYLLGVLKPGTHSGAWHTPDYRADDSAIPVGVRAMSRLLVDYLSSYGQQPSSR